MAIDARGFPRTRLSITLGDSYLEDVASSYATAVPGAVVAIVNSFGLLEIALRDGSAAARPGAGIVEVRAA